MIFYPHLPHSLCDLGGGLVQQIRRECRSAFHSRENWRTEGYAYFVSNVKGKEKKNCTCPVQPYCIQKVNNTFVHVYHVLECMTDSLVVAANSEPYLGSLGAAVHCGKDVVRVHGTEHKGWAVPGSPAVHTAQRVAWTPAFQTRHAHRRQELCPSFQLHLHTHTVFLH